MFLLSRLVSKLGNHVGPTCKWAHECIFDKNVDLGTRNYIDITYVILQQITKLEKINSMRI